MSIRNIETEYKLINRDELSRLMSDISTQTLSRTFTPFEWKWGWFYCMECDECRESSDKKLSKKLIAVTHTRGAISAIIRLKLDECFYYTRIINIEVREYDMETMNIKDIQEGLLNELLKTKGNTCALTFNDVTGYVTELQGYEQHDIDSKAWLGSVTFEKFSELIVAIDDLKLIPLYMDAE
jgi:hypothetical protein